METRPMPQHNAFAWFYIGAFLVAVVAWTMLGNAQKMPETSLQWDSGVSWRGGIGDWLLYVELRRHPGRCRYARHHEQYACPPGYW